MFTRIAGFLIFPAISLGSLMLFDSLFRSHYLYEFGKLLFSALAILLGVLGAILNLFLPRLTNLPIKQTTFFVASALIAGWFVATLAERVP